MSKNRDHRYYCALCRKETPKINPWDHNYVVVTATEYNSQAASYGLERYLQVRDEFSLCPECYSKYRKQMQGLLRLKNEED